MAYRCSTVPGPYGVEPCTHECFSSAASMIGRGWTLYNAPTFSGNGMTLNGTTQYATIPMSRLTAPFFSMPTSGLSLVATFTPAFAPDDGARHTILDANGNSYRILKESYNSIKIDLSSINVLDIVIAVWGAFWVVGGRNQIVVAALSGANRLYLNGNLIGSTVVAWTKPPVPAVMASYAAIGRNYYGGDFFPGTMHDFGIYARQITPAEVTSLWQNGSL